MRFRSALVAVVTAALVAVGGVAPASGASIYDPATASSMRTLVTALASYQMFDNGSGYDGVTVEALQTWGWTPAAGKFYWITIEGDGGSFRATGQDIRAGGTEYTYTSKTAVNGVSPGVIRASDPQPLVAPTRAGVVIVDVGEGVDIDELARQLITAGVGVQTVCDATLALPGTHTLGSSVPDHVLACNAAAGAAGATVRSVLSVLVTVFGAGAATWVAFHFLGDGSGPATVPDWVGTDNPRPSLPIQYPSSLPSVVWKWPKTAERLAETNDLDDQTARVIVEQCLIYASASALSTDPYRDCTSLPIFASGQLDVSEATNHDIEALASNPDWVQLNYRPAAANPSYPGWQRNDPVCQETPTGQNCDEYPFFATVQGGGLAVPRPHLKVIDGPQNQLQGSWYSSFRSACGISDGDPFLGIPIAPVHSGLPTIFVCND